MNFISYSGTYSKEKINFHMHKDYELFIYSSGKGKTIIEDKEYAVEKDMIVLMPPNIMHGSLSFDNLSYIAIRGECNELLHLDTPVIFRDSENGDGFKLLQMIFANRFGEQEYFKSLCFAFINFALNNVKTESPLDKAVDKIKSQISINLHDSNLDVTTLLNQSGYAEDYIRAHFKKLVGKTPVKFLTELRIKNAMTLIRTYHSSMTLMHIASNCGFDDYIYFSRKFKQVVGQSPQTYKNAVINHNK